jgi:hypothetical protein
MPELDEKLTGYWVDISDGVELAEKDGKTQSWIQALPLGKYTHPWFGDIDVTPEKVDRLASSVINKVREIDIDIDYDHKLNTSEAAGWVVQAEARANEGLFLLVDWTEKAVDAIKKKLYKYFSAEFAEEWTHPKTNATYKDVLFGGGLTNRPFIKDILPVNLSELTNDDGSGVIPPEPPKATEPSPPAPPVPTPSHQGGGKGMTTPTKFNELPLDKVKELAKTLGLSDDATAETVHKTLTALADAAPKGQEPEGGGGTPAPSAPQRLAEGEVTETLLADVAKLVGDNPALRVLADVIENQQRELNSTGIQLREAQAQGKITKLNEFALAKKRAFPAAVETELKEIFINAPTQFSEKVFKLMEQIAKSGMIELGEIGRGHGVAVGADLNTRVQRYQESHEGMSYRDALAAVTRDNPHLADVHRQDSYID